MANKKPLRKCIAAERAAVDLILKWQRGEQRDQPYGALNFAYHQAREATDAALAAIEDAGEVAPC